MAILWPVAIFLPMYLLAIKHHPPAGAYIAVAGLLAAVMTLRNEPPPLEKACWIVLITLVTFAEVRNLYVSEAEQAETFSQINRDLKATAEGLEGTQKALGAEVTILESLPPKIDVLDPHLDQLGNQLSATDSALNSQAALMRRQDAIIRREALLNAAPGVIAEMQDFFDGWNTTDLQDRHSRPKGKYAPEYLSNIEGRAQNYSSNLRPTMRSANAIREQLLAGVSEQTSRDLAYPQIIPVFESGVTGQIIQLDDLRKAIGYLKKMVRIISTLPPNQ